MDIAPEAFGAEGRALLNRVREQHDLAELDKAQAAVDRAALSDWERELLSGLIEQRCDDLAALDQRVRETVPTAEVRTALEDLADASSGEVRRGALRIVRRELLDLAQWCKRVGDMSNGKPSDWIVSTFEGRPMEVGLRRYVEDNAPILPGWDRVAVAPVGRDAIPPEELIGNSTMRELCGSITRHTLLAWRRDFEFPAPVVTIGRCEIWDRRAVYDWMGSSVGGCEPRRMG